MEERSFIQRYSKDGRAFRIGYRLHQLNKLQEFILENKQIILTAICSDHSGAQDLGLIERINIYGPMEILKSEYEKLMKDYKKTELPNKINFEFWNSQTALIIGHFWEPFASVIIPLIYAISTGTPAVIKFPKSAKLEKIIINLLPKYLDLEYYLCSLKNVEQLLGQDFDRIIATRLPSCNPGVMERGKGVNVVALLDTNTPINSVLPEILKWKEAGSGLTLCAPDIVLVHELYLNQVVQYFQHHSHFKVKIVDVINEFPTENLPDVLCISSCTTETAILSLETNQVNLFSYFGAQEFGDYILKFAPKIFSAAINKTSLTFYHDLNRSSFQYNRYVLRNSKPKSKYLKLNTDKPDNYKNIKIKPISIKYYRNVGFFEQGFNLSLGIIFGTLTAVIGYGAYHVISYSK